MRGPIVKLRNTKSMPGDWYADSMRPVIQLLRMGVSQQPATTTNKQREGKARTFHHGETLLLSKLGAAKKKKSSIVMIAQGAWRGLQYFHRSVREFHTVAENPIPDLPDEQISIACDLSPKDGVLPSNEVKFII